MQLIRNSLSLILAGLALMLTAPAMASANLSAQPTYADLASWSDKATMVIRAVVKRQIDVPVERAPGLQAGHARLYIEAETAALIAGSSPIRERFSYTVDVPRKANGKPPKLKKQLVVLFARSVPGRSDMVQLVSTAAQLPASAELELRLRPILQQLASADAPPRITGVRDVLPIFGNLVGESETQIFLNTADNSPASLTIVRRPGQDPRWGVSFSEIVDQAARPPEAETIGWYRLACALPSRLPGGAVLADSLDQRRLAERDYALVLRELGNCNRMMS